MQQLMHEKSTSKYQKQSATIEEINRQKEERIAALVSSRRIYRIEQSDVFWVESSKDNVYHYCKMNFTAAATGFKFCSCEDFKYRGHIRDCCHLEVIPLGIMKNKIVDTDKLPQEATKDCNCTVQELCYLEDEYSF